MQCGKSALNNVVGAPRNGSGTMAKRRINLRERR